jgi:HSP20 family protein
MLTLWNDWNPFRRTDFAGELYRALTALEELRTDMDRTFGVRDPGTALSRGFGDGPEIRLSDDGKTLCLRAELPGLSEKDVDVSVNGSTLTLRGERKLEAPEGYSVHRAERPAYRFERAYQLPTKIDAEKAHAVMKNGVLTLTLPKVPEAQPKQIAVKAA